MSTEVNDLRKMVLIVSGGLDSVTLLHKAHAVYPEYELHAISFNYGQRHKKELDYAAYNADLLHATHKIVDLSSITGLLAPSGSSLVSETDVPEGHYGEASMAATVVPNRNMIMLAIAGGYAVAIGAKKLATGVHAGDHYIYPDCRPEFLGLFDRTLYAANEGFISKRFEMWTPFIYKTKNDIAAEAVQHGVPIDHTWSCYKGGDIHCGRCGTCVERLEAIASTGITDPTAYADDQYWKEALKRSTV
jgi:7-cyano-7-deazaguanine synthase